MEYRWNTLAWRNQDATCGTHIIYDTTIQSNWIAEITFIKTMILLSADFFSQNLQGEIKIEDTHKDSFRDFKPLFKDFQKIGDRPIKLLSFEL